MTITLANVEEFEDLRVELVGEGEEVTCLFDARGVKNVERAARHHPPYAKTRRLALLIDTAVGRILGNAFMMVTRPKCPTRMFTSEGKAIDWLLEK